MSLSDFKLKWGHFYDCKDEKRHKIAQMPEPIIIESGETLQVCSTGARLLPAGVEGGMTLTVSDV